jgi:LPXTG-motif cell wall-anchored protein
MANRKLKETDGARASRRGPGKPLSLIQHNVVHRGQIPIDLVYLGMCQSRNDQYSSVLRCQQDAYAHNDDGGKAINAVVAAGPQKINDYMKDKIPNECRHSIVIGDTPYNQASLRTSQETPKYTKWLIAGGVVFLGFLAWLALRRKRHS